MKVGDIFGKDKLSEYSDFANENNLYIADLPSIEGVDEDGEPIMIRQFILAEVPEPTEEEIKDGLRLVRSRLLEAFDKWEKAVLRGREEDSEEVMIWYRSILDLNETAIKNVPAKIDYYIDKTIK